MAHDTREKNKVLKQLISATGISEDLISDELKLLSARAGLRPQELTIEDLRQILSEYVQEVLLSAKEHFDAKKVVAVELTPLFPGDVS